MHNLQKADLLILILSELFVKVKIRSNTFDEAKTGK